MSTSIKKASSKSKLCRSKIGFFQPVGDGKNSMIMWKSWRKELGIHPHQSNYPYWLLTKIWENLIQTRNIKQQP
jgi:hypothetical protein